MKSMRLTLEIIALLMCTTAAVPIPANALEYRVQKYDPYSPSTPNLYRRERRSETCQLPANVRNGIGDTSKFQGWLFPGLYWGYCPLTFGIAPVRQNPRSPFGPL
jgi:hypothetical protein